MAKRLNVEMTEDAYYRLADAAKEQQTSVSELVRRAINVDLYLKRQAKDGVVRLDTDDGIKEILVG